MQRSIETHIKNIDRCEESFIRLFCNRFKFSNNLIKYEDDCIFDMYDHNYFKHNSHVTLDEVLKAYQFQYDNYLDYLKFISKEKINKKIINALDLESSTILTMLFTGNINKFKVNKDIKIKRINLKELNQIELKHYGKVYGEDFIRRRNKEFIRLSKQNPNFVYYGVYLNNKIVGECHSYTHKDYTCIDSLLVDDKYRNQYIATTLLKYIIDKNKYVYLHADQDDTPKDMYKKLGFKTIDKSYEYFKKVELDIKDI